MDILSGVDRGIRTVLQNPYLTIIIRLFLALYGGLVAPNLPPLFASYLDSPIVKIIGITLILVLMNYDTTTSLLVAIAFVLTMISVNNLKLFALGDVLVKQQQQQPQQPLQQEPELPTPRNEPMETSQSMDNSSSLQQKQQQQQQQLQQQQEDEKKISSDTAYSSCQIPPYAQNIPNPSSYEPSTRINTKRDLMTPDAPYEATNNIRYGNQPLDQTAHFPPSPHRSHVEQTTMPSSGVPYSTQGLQQFPSPYDGPMSGATIGTPESEL